MINKIGTLITVIALFMSNYAYNQSVHLKEIEKTRSKININSDWRFKRDTVPEGFASSGFDNSNWEMVSVPHTMKLEPADIYFLGDEPYHQKFQRYIGWYRKKLKINARPGQKVFLEFEGAHQVTQCWVNGKYVGEHALGGYTPFHFEITDYIEQGSQEATVVLSIDNRPNKTVPPDGDMMDFIKYSGLYRDVYLVVTSPVYITFPWEDRNAGVFITTPSVTKENATVSIRTTVNNAKETSVLAKLTTRLIDQEGYVVKKVSASKEIKANSNYTFLQTTGITEDLQLWSINNPYLYRVQSLVYVDGELVDLVENPLGVRKISFEKGKGFLLNEEVVELIGVNKHQAYPYIGDAVPDALLIKDAIQFKDAGFNVVRLAHYPHDNAFIRACDELGILLIEEAPTWIAMRRGEWFDNLVEVNRRMIRNHRNHPSIIMWSGGINHRGAVEQLHYSCKEEDPTRHTASNGSPWSGPRNSGVADIYTPMDYKNFGIKDIDFSFLCEHGSSADAMVNQFEVSLSRQSASRFGVAMWTAHDYFSFKRDWGMVPRRPFSIYRVPNPVMYWYKSELLEEPMVYIADERAGNNNVTVFSNCHEVALYNNGNLVARQRADSDPERLYCKNPSFTFILNNARGDLEAKGYVNGDEVASYKLNKYGEPYKIELVVEEDGMPIEASGWDMRMIRAYITDKDGNHVISDTSLVTFLIKGKGEIIGGAEIGANPNKAYWGTASAILRSTKEPGEITISATSNGLKGSSVKIESVTYNNNVTFSGAKPVFDYPVYKVDMGGEGQLEQFQWESWTDGEPGKSSYVLDSTIGSKVTVASQKNSMKWTTAFGMSGNLPYLAMDGIVAEPSDVLTITFEGMPKGEYTLNTFHHSHKEIENITGQAILYKNPNMYQVSIVDDFGERIIYEDLEPTSGSYMDNRWPRSSNLKFLSNGAGSVQVVITNPANDTNIYLNGFVLKRRN